MPVSKEQLEQWLNDDENEHLEFKAARDGFSVERLLNYCCALANETGGTLILGVTDKKPRKAVGSNAFRDLNQIKQQLISALSLRVELEEVIYHSKRLLIFSIPSRPIGVPKKTNNIYWMRRGEALTAMTEDMLHRIFNEAVPDFSAQICERAAIEDLSKDALEEFRKRWQQRSGNASLAHLSLMQFLADAELMYDNKITYAALILFGHYHSLGRLLPQAEVIFEYRTQEIAGPANHRVEFREGFFLYYEKLWELVNLRNTVQHFQDGLFMREIPTFSEISIREAVLNAVSHRDYQNPGSVFIRQYQENICIESPGGFPPGITIDNILDRQSPRNRRIAETLSKAGFVERSGQGVNRMFEESIIQGKETPDFSASDSHIVILTLDGRVRDVNFLKFLEAISRKRNRLFTSNELVILEKIHKGAKLPTHLKPMIDHFKVEGVIESIGRNKYILNRNFYTIAGKKGVYTRTKGLDRQTNLELLLKHIRENAASGSRLEELMQVLPSLNRGQTQSLLRLLSSQNKIFKTGNTRASLWFPRIEKTQ